jgi:hypothetical protein
MDWATVTAKRFTGDSKRNKSVIFLREYATGMKRNALRSTFGNVSGRRI